RRHSPAVYRRRRIVLLVALLAIAGVVWLLIAQPWRGSAAQTQGTSSNSGDTTTDAGVTELPVPKDGSKTPSAASTPSATPAASPSATPSSTPASTPAAAPCRAGDIA